MVVSLKLAILGWGKHKTKQKKEAYKQQLTLHTKTQKLVPVFFVLVCFFYYFLHTVLIWRLKIRDINN